MYTLVYPALFEALKGRQSSHVRCTLEGYYYTSGTEGFVAYICDYPPSSRSRHVHGLRELQTFSMPSSRMTMSSSI